MARIKSDLSQEAFNYIKSKINNYDLKPMDTVSDIAISQELNMSRTPVKEAIIQLTRCGLIKKERTKFSVVPITEKDVVEILEIRETLDLFSARKICKAGGLTENQIVVAQELVQNLKQSIETLNFSNNFNFDNQFHKYLVECSNNARAISIGQDIMLQGERLRWLSMITLDRYFKAADEHEQIITALENADLDSVEKAIRSHYENTLKNYLTTINQNKDWQDIIINLKLALASSSDYGDCEASVP